MKNCQIIFFFFLGIFTSINWGQSIFSLNYPLGLPLNSNSSSAHQMGGVSVGIPNDHNIMLTNPGNLGAIDNIAFSSLLSIDYLRISDAGSYTDHMSVLPQQVSFALPLGYAGTVAFSISKPSNASFKFRTTEPFGRISVHRNGGFNSWQAGIGHSIGEFVNIGFAYERGYFTVKQNKFTESTDHEMFEQDSSGLSFRGNGIRMGIMGTIKEFAIGIAGNYYFEDNLTYRQGLYTGSETSAYSTSGSLSMQPPPAISGGVSYSFSPKLLVGADVAVTLWDYYSISQEGILVDISNDNSVMFALGARFIPAPNLLAPKYWETMHYRAGFRYAQLPGNTSQEFAGTLGVGFPLKGNGLFDFGMEIGNRTSDTFNNYNETFLHFSIGINGGGKWHKTNTNTY